MDKIMKNQGVRKSGRIALKRSFSKFTNTVDEPLILEEGVVDEEISVPKVAAGTSQITEQAQRTDDSMPITHDAPAPNASVPRVETGRIRGQGKKIGGKDPKSKAPRLMDEGSDFVDDPPPSKKKRAVKNRKRVDVDGPIVENSKVAGIRVRTTPTCLFETMKKLTDDQKNVVIQMGFESLLKMRVDGIPAHLGYYVIDNFNPAEKVIVTDGGRVEVTREKIHRLLGIPMGDIKLELSPEGKDEDGEEIEMWRKQFLSKAIRPWHISRMITDKKEADFNFMLSFIVLFANVIGRCISNGTCYLNLLSQVKPGTDISKLDWCGYVMDCLPNCKKCWRPKVSQTLFCGPMTLLTLLYVESVRCESFKIISQGLAINSWTMEKLRKREKEEKRLGGFGKGEVIDICKKTTNAHQVEGDQTEEMDIDQMNILLDDYCNELDGAINVIVDRKCFFEETIKGAKVLFPGNSSIQKREEDFNRTFNQMGSNDKNEGQDHSSDVAAQGLQIVVSPQKQTSRPGCLDGDQMTDTQYWVNPSVMEEVFRTVDQVSRHFVSPCFNSNMRPKRPIHFFDDIPSFSLGLTQENENTSPMQLTVFNQNSEANPTDVQPISMDKDDGPEVTEADVRPRRQRKIGVVLCSPYVNRQVQPNQRLSKDELMISEWVFAMQGPKMQPIFETLDTPFAPRDVFESMVQDEFLFNNVIDVWATVLNWEERLRSKTSPTRLFCGAGAISDYLLTLGEDKVMESMSKEIETACKYDTDLIGLHKVDLVFFPIKRGDHFYLLVFNFKISSYILMDNSVSDQDFDERYGDVPYRLQALFWKYLRSLDHKKTKSVKLMKLKRWAMHWRTRENGVDCGVFVMRHMEAYMGEKENKWDAGLFDEGSKQKNQLNNLRIKYLAKILLSDINLRKEVVVKEAEEFSRVDLNERRCIIRAAYLQKDQRRALEDYS